MSYDHETKLTELAISLKYALDKSTSYVGNMENITKFLDEAYKLGYTNGRDHAWWQDRLEENDYDDEPV